MPRKFRLSAKTLTTLIIFTVILIIFISSGGTLRPVLDKLNNTLTFTDVCRGMPDDDEIELQIIDVGQGDCALIRSVHGNILIDSGTSLSQTDLRDHLDFCKVKKIDYFFCSHAHDDHIGGADMIIANFDVKNLIIPKSSDTSFTLERTLKAAADKNLFPTYPNVGDVYTLEDITVTVLSDGRGTAISNDASLVLMISFGEIDFLFTGDIGEDTERHLIDTYGANALDCEFLKIAHHGANESSSEDFLTAVTPALASVSCERHNSYGHPRGEVLRRLKLCGCDIIFRTDTMGTCILRTDGSSVYFMASSELAPQFQ